MKRRNLIPLTFLLLAPALVAGAAKAQDMPVQEDDWITATAGGKKVKTDTATIAGCGSKTLESGYEGGYIVAKCTDACTSKFWRWRFWVTKYKVSGTVRLGEHQGIWIVGEEYKFDKRFLAKDGITHLWLPGNTPPYGELILNPQNEDVSKHALCESRNVVKKVINNHGRTLATVSPKGGWDITITGTPIKSLRDHKIGPLDYAQWSSSDDSVSGKAADNITQCLKKILDGYCDSVCGNCSYVLPRDVVKFGITVPGTYGGQVFDWSTQEGGGTVNYTAKQTYQIKTASAVGLPGTKSQIMRTFRDDFTHCVKPGVAPQQSLLIGTPSHLDGVVSGLYGHNSNTDAEAEFLQFEACIKKPSVDKRSSCRECGKDRINHANRRMEQWPCINMTNEAEQSWPRSAHLQNVDDSTLGTYAEKQPFCHGNTKRPVHGM